MINPLGLNLWEYLDKILQTSSAPIYRGADKMEDDVDLNESSYSNDEEYNSNQTT